MTDKPKLRSAHKTIDRKIETVRKFHALELLPPSVWDDLLREDAERASAQPAAYVCPTCGALDCTKNHAEFM